MSTSALFKIFKFYMQFLVKKIYECFPFFNFDFIKMLKIDQKHYVYFCNLIAYYKLKKQPGGIIERIYIGFVSLKHR